MLKTHFVIILEKFIGWLIAQDVLTPMRLAPLDNKVIALKITDIEESIFILIEKNKLRLFDEWEDHIDTEIEGTLASFYSLIKHKGKITKSLHISGDLSCIEALKKVFMDLDIDWEAFFAKYTGDEMAYAISDTLHTASTVAKDFVSGFKDNLRTYKEDKKVKKLL